MRIKQPKMLFPRGKEKRPRQDIPTEAARIKARMARMSVKNAGLEKTDAKPKP
jgi:hypothetical protein